MRPDKTLDFVRSLEHPKGGLRAWPGHHQYPECTGYTIPTLQAFGEDELADRCAMWLVGIQNPNGSYPGLDGKERTFDTAAIIEGLRASSVEGAQSAAIKAENWLMSMRGDNGVMRVAVHNNESRCYTMRVNGIMDDDSPAEYWLTHLLSMEGERTHYVMYCLEGLYKVGMKHVVKPWLRKAERQTKGGILPYTWNGGGTDNCATAQFGLLKAWCGLDYTEQLNALRNLLNDDGSLPLDSDPSVRPLWPTKFYLDLEAQYLDKFIGEAVPEEPGESVNAVAVVVGINHWEDITKPFVKSLRRHNPNLPVLVVDNASKRPYPDHEVDGAKILRLDQRTGYNLAMNAAIEATPGRDWYILFNNDCMCSGAFTKELMALDPNRLYGSGLNYDRLHSLKLQWSAWMCLSAKVLDKVGLFDPKLSAAFEDFDYQLRAMKAGFEVESFNIPVRHLDKHTRFEEHQYEKRWHDSRDYYFEKHGFGDKKAAGAP